MYQYRDWFAIQSIGAVNILQIYAFKNKTFDQLQNIIKYFGTSHTTAHEKNQLKKR